MALVKMLDTTGQGRTAAQVRSALELGGLASADGVAGYIDSLSRWPAGAWSAFPGKRKVRISTEANELAEVFDFENGTAGLGAVRRSVLARWEASLASVVYVDFTSWEEAKGALEGLPVAWWVADWTSSPAVLPEPAVPAGACARQFYSAAEYDLSVIDTELWPSWSGP